MRQHHIALLIFLLLNACAPASLSVEKDSRSITVFAAASLTNAFTETGTAFEAANPGVTVVFNFAGSQALRTQIEEGAPVDIFASANIKEMDALVAGAFIAEDAPQIFLTNKLVVILPADNPAGIIALEDLANSRVKIVLAAEDVPVGRYSREAFDLMNASFSADFKDRLLANVVSNEDNVKQVVAKVQLGEADAGIVYTSDAVAAPELQIINIPPGMNVIAEYPIAPLKESTNTELGAAFIEYILSADGRTTLAKWGFGPTP